MCLCMPARAIAFEHLLDQVDTATRPIEFITGELIGRAGRIAEAAVYTVTQDTIRLLAMMRFEIAESDRGLHSSLYSLAGFRMLLGSRAYLMRLCMASIPPCSGWNISSDVVALVEFVFKV